MRPNISSILRALPGAENLLDRAERGGAPGCFSGGAHVFPPCLLKNARTFPRSTPFSTSPHIRSFLLHIAFRKYFIPITPLFSKFFIIPLSFVKGVTDLPTPNEIRAAKCAVSCAAACRTRRQKIILHRAFMRMRLIAYRFQPRPPPNGRPAYALSIHPPAASLRVMRDTVERLIFSSAAIS